MDIKTYLNAPIPRWLAAVAILATATTGVVGTYLVTRKQFLDEIDERVRMEVDATVKFQTIINNQAYASPEEAVAALQDPMLDFEPDVSQIVADYTTDDDTGDLIEVAKNVWTDAKDFEFDLEEEKAKRTNDAPYILEHDEFYESDLDFTTLTWFEGDEVLADERDEHIPDIEMVVGEANLLRFGAGSRDPNVLYVHNPKLDRNFEILKNEGKYTEQILGFVEHSDETRVLRFRPSDE